MMGPGFADDIGRSIVIGVIIVALFSAMVGGCITYIGIKGTGYRVHIEKVEK